MGSVVATDFVVTGLAACADVLDRRGQLTLVAAVLGLDQCRGSLLEFRDGSPKASGSSQISIRALASVSSGPVPSGNCPSTSVLIISTTSAGSLAGSLAWATPCIPVARTAAVVRDRGCCA